MDTRFYDYNPVKHGASAMIHNRAKHLRKTMTPAEIRLWQALKGTGLNGLSFRRQQPILGFIVDFYCHQRRLVIELDGPIHDQTTQRDTERDAVLIQAGMTILRFRNQQVFANPDQVLHQILQAAYHDKNQAP